jgi:hypothetical protein
MPLMSNVRFLMHRSLLVVAALLLPVAGAMAADDTGALARQFVELLRYEDQFVKYREQCVATHRTVSPEALVGKNAEYFGGIRPGHRNWQAIVTAYESYFQEACSRPSKKEFLGTLSASYAKALSAQQLREAIVFYSSPTGQALVAAHKAATATVYEAWTAINGKHLAELSARFQGEVARLVQSK